MTELMRQIIERKRGRRKELAALPVGEKLRMLEEMIASTRAIAATRPPKNANRGASIPPNAVTPPPPTPRAS